jgi:hypothetical protein
MPAWVVEWCARELGAAPVGLEALGVDSMSRVRAVHLDDDRTVVLKARPAAEAGRASTCVDIQRALAREGFPCARPLTDVVVVDDLAVHGEEWLPGGEMMRGDGPAAAASSAQLLSELMRVLEHVDSQPPLPNPEWVRWDHDGPGLFPPNPRHDTLAAAVALPDVVEETARRVRSRMQASTLTPVVGHADWETQNLRWHAGEPYVVHDWDSLAWLSEAALVGAAAGAFASAEVPTLAPLESSQAFLEAYVDGRGRSFSAEETQIAWAASLWPAVHNARAQVIYSRPAPALEALERQAERRLRLAHA